MDSRNIITGSIVPSEAYCDQVYVVKTDDKAWLAVMTTGIGKEGERGQHIIALRSKNEGKTWSAPVNIEPADGPEASYAVVLKTLSGRIYAFYNYNTDQVKEVKHEDGGAYSRVDSLGHYVFKYSDDHGLTWSDRRYDIPIREFVIDRENIYQGKIRFFWNVGRPFVDEVGKAYLPHIKVAAMGQGFFAQSEGAFLCSPNLLSEPDPEKIVFDTLPEGETGLRTPAGGGRIAEEQSVVPLSDGSLYCVYRSIDGYPVCTYSRNEGKTWEAPAYKTYQPGGQVMKHPRAANFVWRCENGRYLYWYHNHGGGPTVHGKWNPYDDRNPVWITAGREVETPEGLKLAWSQPEIILYDDDPCIRMSYPDLIEESGGLFLTETQKAIARVHQLDARMLDLIFHQHELAAVVREGLILDLDSDALRSGEIAMPRLPDFYVRDYSTDDQSGKRTRAGFSIDLVAESPGNPGPVNLLDSMSPNGRGLRIEADRDGRLRLEFSDGRTRCAWVSQRDVLNPGKSQTITLIVDGGPCLITAVVDGILLDGSEEFQFGWGRFSPYLMSANGKEQAVIASKFVKNLRIYNRALLTSEAVANWRSSQR